MGIERKEKRMERQSISVIKTILESTSVEKLPEVLKPGGRAAILTFHSGEDRLVKKSFKRFLKEGIYCEIAEDAIRPSREECARNSRAKSTKMRWAIRA